MPERKSSVSVGRQEFLPPEDTQDGRGIFPYDWSPNDKDSKWKDGLRKLISEEAVQHLDDLIFRRTTLWENPSRVLGVAQLICGFFDWDDSRCSMEIKRLTKKLESWKA